VRLALIGWIVLVCPLAAGGGSAAAAPDPTRPGTPDRTFSTDGVLRASLGLNEARTEDMATLRDGRIVVLGSHGRVARFLPDGRLDRTFGAGGTMTVDLAGDSHDELDAMFLGDDGRILLGGHQRADRPAVARLLPDGRPDPTFDRDGTSFRELGTWLYGSDLAVAPDGTVYVATARQACPECPQVVVSAFDPSGRPIQAFGRGGAATIDVPPGVRYLDDVHLLRAQDGRLVIPLGGVGGERALHLAALTPDGRPDLTLGPQGIREIGQGYDAGLGGATLTRDGGILLAGRPSFGRTRQMAVLRLTSRGDPDPTWGTGGVVRLRLPFPILVGDIAAAASGHIAVALTEVRAQPFRGLRMGAVLLRRDGSRATSFGRAGVARLPTVYGRHAVLGTNVAFAGNRLVVGGGTGDGLSGIRDDFGRDWVALGRFRLARAVVRMPSRISVTRRGRAALRLRCRPFLVCAVTVRLSGRGIRVRRRVTIGRSGRTGTLRLRLGRRGRALAVRRRTLRLSASVTIVNRTDARPLPDDVFAFPLRLRPTGGGR